MPGSDFFDKLHTFLFEIVLLAIFVLELIPIVYRRFREVSRLFRRKRTK